MKLVLKSVENECVLANTENNCQWTQFFFLTNMVHLGSIPSTLLVYGILII